MGCCGDDKMNAELYTYAGDGRSEEELAAAGWPGKKLSDSANGKCDRYFGAIVDAPYCGAFLCFWIGMFVIAAIAFDKGDPYRLVYGQDYRGQLCGQGDTPPGWAAMIAKCTLENGGVCPYQSAEWSENENLFLPFPFTGDLERKFVSGGNSLPLSITTAPAAYFLYWQSADMDDIPKAAADALASGVCVKSCPSYNGKDATGNYTRHSSVFNNAGLLQKHLDGTDPTLPKLGRAYTYGRGSRGQEPGPGSDSYFFTWYDSKSHLKRCLPTGDLAYVDGPIIKEAINYGPDIMGMDSMWQNSLTELGKAWRVLVLCAGMAMIFPVIYAAMMRQCLKVWVYVGIVLFFIIFVAGGCIACYKWHLLSNNTIEDDDDDAMGWLAVAIILWICAFIYLIIIICFRNQLNTAIALIQEGTKVLGADYTLLLVPILTAISISLLYMWCNYVWLYIYTIQEDPEVFNASVSGGAIGVPDISVNLTTYPADTSKQNLIYYYVFGWLWTMGVLTAIGYFVIAGTTVKWYYSFRGDGESGDSKNLTTCCGWLECYWWAIQHLGGIAMGTFLVAVIQFLRFLIDQTVERMREMGGDSSLVTFLHCIIDCILACVERCLQYITFNAYIIMAIEGTGFWCACCKLIPILLDNLTVMSFVGCISSLVFCIGKFICAGLVLLICYAGLQDEHLAPGVENGLLIMVIVGLTAYLIATVFMYIYEVCIDTLVILVCRERQLMADGKINAKDCAMGADLYKAVTGEDQHPGEWTDEQVEGLKSSCQAARDQRNNPGAGGNAPDQ